MWECMCDCFKKIPSERPSFESLCERLSQLCPKKVSLKVSLSGKEAQYISPWEGMKQMSQSQEKKKYDFTPT
jgi:hypothetical protein